MEVHIYVDGEYDQRDDENDIDIGNAQFKNSLHDANGLNEDDLNVKKI